jgi:hypothetical protein
MDSLREEQVCQIYSQGQETTYYFQEAGKSGTVVTHCKENPIYVFLFWEWDGLSPNFHIHVFVSDLYVYSKDWSTYFPEAE